MNKKYGLTTAQVEESKQKYGDNRLTIKESQTLWEMFVDSFKDKWIIILLLALGIKIMFNFIGMIFPNLGSVEWYDAISILAAILLSTGFSTVSSYRNEQKFNALQEEASKTKAKVYRDGQLVEILVDDIVMGDVILLQTGDKVPADGILLEGSCKVNQAVLNGESEDAKKVVLGDNPVPPSNDLFTELKIFRGTVVTSGEAVMEVTDIGDKTVLGSINTSLQESNKESPSKEKLNKLADNIGVLGYSGGGVAAVINLILGIVALNTAGSLTFANIFLLIMESIMYGVTIVIMAVPEGLPMMMALVSAMNSGKLLSKHILVRHSESIETAGYMNILFSDKTGTITEGVLSVVDLVLGDGTMIDSIKNMDEKLRAETIKGMGLNNDANVSEQKAIGSNSTDRAFLEYLINNDALDFNRDDVVEKEAFNSATKFASVTTKDGTKYIKGAPEILLKKCKYYLDSTGTRKEMTPEVMAKLDEASLAQANRAMRLLAVMKRDIGSEDYTLITIVCIRDNVRPDVKHTVETMNRAGVQVVMVTGDRKETAMAIAKESGIMSNSNDVALTHDELDALSDDDLKAILHNLRVVSRALPMDKKRLVNAAQELGLVCGMTGDGVNDSPALKAADVGFSVGDGSEVAKEASDIVILNNSLTSIENATLYGRTMSKSVSKFIIFQLTVNVATILMSVIAPLFGWAEPFTIVQILWINLIMDTLAALAFGEEPALERYMYDKPVSRQASILTSYIKSAIGTASIFITLVCLGILTNIGNVQSLIVSDQASAVESDGIVRTFMFTFFIYAIIFNSLNTRSTGFNVFEHIGENKKFIIVMGGIAIAQSLIIQFGGKVFSTVPMDLTHFLMALGLAVLIIPVDFIRKTVVNHSSNS